jgi:peptide/nickel transport system substrate-binding protein
VQIDYVTFWEDREQLFLEGKSDVTVVPRNYYFRLLDNSGEPIDPKIKTVKSISPVLSMDAVFYTWNINTTVYNSLYTGLFPTGAPTDFMNNVHVRNAFSYAFNHTKFLQLYPWWGEGDCRETPGILGLYPDYYTKGQWTATGGTGKFNYNLTAMEAELKQAYFVQGAENKRVWDWGGFHIDIFYSSGNDPGRMACGLIKEGFDALNAASGKNFQISIQAPDWATYAGVYLEASCMPVWCIGWLADYADAGNWYGPYMHSFGDFSIYQHYPPTTLGPRTGLNKDALIDFAFKTPDGPTRANMYADLDDIYLIDNPSFPIIQAQGRRWQKYWVRGWYYNALYPSGWYYNIYKVDTCWANVNGPTAGVPDAKTDMRDVSYVAGHFGAKAPNPGALPPAPIYDPKWAPGFLGHGGCDLVGDRKVDMRDVAFAAAHFLHEAQP